MPMLALNGVTIPTLYANGTSPFVEIGERTRAFDGTMLTDRRALKREWKFTTPPMSDLQFQAVSGLILGRGYSYPFDTDLYAANGLGGTGVITQYSSAAADGAAVFDENGVANTKFVAGSVAGEAGGVSNLMTSAMSMPNTTTGFGASAGSTITLDSSNYFTGTNSIKVVTASASGNGLFMSTKTAGVLNTTYTGTVYIKTSGVIDVTINDDANSTSALTTVTGVNGSWRRVSVTFTTLSSGSTPQLSMTVVNHSTGSVTVYVGGFKIEQSSFPTSWVAGGSSRVATSLTYAQNPMGPAGLTVNWWMTKPPTNPSSAVVWSTWDGTANNYIALFTGAGSPNIFSFETRNNGVQNDISTSALTYSTWNMMTCVFRVTPETGESYETLYVNGTQKLAGGAALPSTSVMTQFSIGYFLNGGGLFSYNRIDDMQVLPYPVDSTWVTGMYNAGVANGLTPLVTATGSFTNESSVTVVGQIDDVKVQGYFDSTAGIWRKNGRSVSFTLQEV